MTLAVFGARNRAPLSIAKAKAPLLEAVQRYMSCALDPKAQAVLEPLIYEEIHFHLLLAPNSAMLRRSLSLNSKEAQIIRAVERLKADFRSALPVESLAQEAAMSVSAFHKTFKEVTGYTPLQYQKDLRMSEAQNLLARGQLSVSQVAYAVGYESASQFSREYTRRFLEPPSQHLGKVLEAV